MLASTDKLSIGVKRRQPVTVRSASLTSLSIKRVLLPRHHAGAEYLTVERTRTKVAVCRVFVVAPKIDLASSLMNPTRNVGFRHSDFKCLCWISTRRSDSTFNGNV